jgi:nucleotide-binding universal stress UspA family protein
MATAQKILPQTGLKFEKIAVLTDFLPTADAALRCAARLARDYGAKIILAHAYLPPSCACAAPEAALAFEAFDQCRQNLQDRLLEKVQTPYLRGIDCSVVLEQGSPRDLLDELIGADLIAVGTSGQTGLRKSLLGSTAELIFRTSPKPVLTVGPHCHCTGEGNATLRTVLCAVDFSSGAADTLAYALSVTRQHNAELLLLHVVEKHDITLALEQACARAEVFEKFRKLLLDSPPYSKTTYLVDFGDADTEIVNEARRYGADLIVLGAHRTRVPALASRFTDGTAYSVAASADCPVLTIPSGTGLTLGVTGITES